MRLGDKNGNCLYRRVLFGPKLLKVMVSSFEILPIVYIIILLGLVI